MQPFKRRESSKRDEDTRRDVRQADQQDTSEGQKTSEEPANTDRPEDTEKVNDTASGQGSQPDLQAQSEQSEAAAQVPEWNPSIDVFTKGEDFVIRAALAGVGPEEVKITLSGGVLTFSGQGQSEDSSEGYRVREIQRGPFRRSVSLPADRDSEKVKAALENGVLEITVQGGAGVTNEVQIGG